MRGTDSRRDLVTLTQSESRRVRAIQEVLDIAENIPGTNPPMARSGSAGCAIPRAFGSLTPDLMHRENGGRPTVVVCLGADALPNVGSAFAASVLYCGTPCRRIVSAVQQNHAIALEKLQLRALFKALRTLPDSVDLVVSGRPSELLRLLQHFAERGNLISDGSFMSLDPADWRELEHHVCDRRLRFTRAIPLPANIL